MRPSCSSAGSVVHWQKPASMFGTVFMGQFGMLHMMQDSACGSKPLPPSGPDPLKLLMKPDTTQLSISNACRGSVSIDTMRHILFHAPSHASWRCGSAAVPMHACSLAATDSLCSCMHACVMHAAWPWLIHLAHACMQIGSWASRRTGSR